MKKITFLYFLGCCLISAQVNAYWQVQNGTNLTSNTAQKKFSPSIFQLDIDQFNSVLNGLEKQSSIKIKLPRADGSLSSFYVTQTQVLAADLAYKYPNLKTFKIQHINDSDVRGRMEFIDDRLSVMIKTGFSQELLSLNTNGFQSYQVLNRSSLTHGAFSCGTKLSQTPNSLSMKLPLNNQYRSAPNTLKKLRVAIATTVEYSEEFCGTTSTVLAEIAVALNRINEVYESELAITLELVSNNEDIIFLNNDAYDNDDAIQMIDANQTIIDQAIGNGNYDLGHVFSTGGGGLASVGVVCSSSNKASGVTGRSSPFDDAFWIDFVAHEMGHQLGAEHTFNGSTRSCSGNRVSGSAYEPGSGSTVMAYAGICGSENLQANSDASFHFNSINEIDNEISSRQNCGVDVSYTSVHAFDRNDNSPIADAGNDFEIPVNTPFMLTAVATDADGDVLYYQWDGADQGSSTHAETLGIDNGGVLFRSNLPQTHAVRYFPSLFHLLTHSDDKGDTLPTTNRDVNLILKVTDNKGGYDTDSVKLTSHTSIGTFAVTSQSIVTHFNASQSVLVNWDVANTTSAPVSCANVEIQLLTMNDDSSTFCKETLASEELNDGSALVVLPDKNSAVSRLLIKCEDNVFFAINSQNISITGGSSDVLTNCYKTGFDNSLSDTAFVSTASTCVAEPEPEEPEPSSESGGGGGFISLGFLAFLSSLLLARRRI